MLFRSLFTGNSADSSLSVYGYGRNADSGTRISALGESYRGVTQRPAAHLQPTFSGSTAGVGGRADKLITGLAKWPLESVLGTTYTAGQGGYSGGGDLAAALTCYGAQTVTPTSFARPGYVIGYLGRSDASTACAQTNGLNTAHRLTFNGEQDWIGTSFTDAGAPASGFNDDAVRQGHYHAWEFEHLYYRNTASASHITVITALYNSIISSAAASGTINLNTMVVTKSVEGGAISHQ